MEITNEWLKENYACESGYKWALKRNYDDAFQTIQELVNISRIDWANWVIVRLMDRKQKIQYAIFAAELVIDIYEKKYPNDKRPRNAIETAKNVLNNKQNTDANADNAAAAAYAANADAAAYAAYAAANAAYAANADNAAAAAYAANAAYAYAAYAKKEIQIKILNFGLSLLQIEERL